MGEFKKIAKYTNETVITSTSRNAHLKEWAVKIMKISKHPNILSSIQIHSIERENEFKRKWQYS